jgi:hypothetical protein
VSHWRDDIKRLRPYRPELVLLRWFSALDRSVYDVAAKLSWSRWNAAMHRHGGSRVLKHNWKGIRLEEVEILESRFTLSAEPTNRGIARADFRIRIVASIEVIDLKGRKSREFKNSEELTIRCLRENTLGLLDTRGEWKVVPNSLKPVAPQQIGLELEEVVS